MDENAQNYEFAYKLRRFRGFRSDSATLFDGVMHPHRDSYSTGNEVIDAYRGVLEAVSTRLFELAAQQTAIQAAERGEKRVPLKQQAKAALRAAVFEPVLRAAD